MVQTDPLNSMPTPGSATEVFHMSCAFHRHVHASSSHTPPLPFLTLDKEAATFAAWDLLSLLQQ